MLNWQPQNSNSACTGAQCSTGSLNVSHLLARSPRSERREAAVGSGISVVSVPEVRVDLGGLGKADQSLGKMLAVVATAR